MQLKKKLPNDLDIKPTTAQRDQLNMGLYEMLLEKYSLTPFFFTAGGLINISPGYTVPSLWSSAISSSLTKHPHAPPHGRRQPRWRRPLVYKCRHMWQVASRASSNHQGQVFFHVKCPPLNGQRVDEWTAVLLDRKWSGPRDRSSRRQPFQLCHTVRTCLNFFLKSHNLTRPWQKFIYSFGSSWTMCKVEMWIMYFVYSCVCRWRTKFVLLFSCHQYFS